MMFRRLKEFPLKPGPWWRVYAAEYSQAFGIPIDEVIKHSAIVEGTNGEIWCTRTAEWDKAWFNKRGFLFPRRWIPYERLDGYQGAPGSVVRLDV